MWSVPRRLRLNASGERAGRESEALAGVRELLEQARGNVGNCYASCRQLDHFRQRERCQRRKGHGVGNCRGGPCVQCCCSPAGFLVRWHCRRGLFNAVHLREGTRGREQGETRCRVVNGRSVKMRFPDGTSGPSPARTRCGRRSIIHALRAREHGPQGVLWHYFPKLRLGCLVERPNGIAA